MSMLMFFCTSYHRHEFLDMDFPLFALQQNQRGSLAMRIRQGYEGPLNGIDGFRFPVAFGISRSRALYEILTFGMKAYHLFLILIAVAAPHLAVSGKKRKGTVLVKT